MSERNGVVGVPDMLPAPRMDSGIEPTSLLATIMQLATRPGINVENIERLVALHERAEARQAEREFNAALLKCQSAMEPIIVDAKSDKAKYATYFALDREVRPVYTANGFAVTFSTGEAPADCVKVLGWLLHEGGHQRQYEILMPADGKGAKGNDVMTRTHATGSAMTYGKRYLLVDMFNLAIDKDDDGTAAGGINNAQVETIKDLIQETGTDTQKFCEYFRIDTVGDLSRKDYQRAKDYLRRKAGPQKAPDYL